MSLLSVSCVKDYTQFVDPFIGTGGDGHTFPGACAPFGMVQPSPVTGHGNWAHNSEYVYDDTDIFGFTQNHLNGTGCPDLGNVLIMPASGELVRPWNGYRSGFEKSNEKASVGYYSVYLDQPKVRVEITASERVALYRMRYDGEGKKGLLIDLQHSPAYKPHQLHTHVKECQTEWLDNKTLVGTIKDKMWTKQTYSFIAEFNHPIIHKETLPILENEKAPRYVVEFNIRKGEELMVKIALSSVSVEGAKANLAEVSDWDFDGVHRKTKQRWNKLLSRAEVNGTIDEKKIFYTGLYHAFIQPNLHSDADGRYRNAADQIIKSEASHTYSTFSLWDTYRAAHSLYTILTPELVNDFVISMLEQCDAQGYLPVWALWGNETHCMIANHAIPVITEAWRKGFRAYDGKRALEAMCKSQTTPHRKLNDWDMYMKYGYYPVDKVHSRSVSVTMENAYDDYALAEMAKMIGDEECRAHYARRAEFFKNIYDSKTKYPRPRLADGSWQTPFQKNRMVPYAEGGAFVEATPSQYAWHVQHDVDWLIEFMGGKEEFVKELDTLFEGEIIANQLDITGLIGQYAHGNEPCHHIPYLYTLADRPDRAAEVIREVIDTMYSARPDGLCGNEDCGQMSSWYIFSSMGFYPIDPVSCKYILGAPQIKSVTLHLGEGKNFTTKAEGLSRRAKYVKSVYLNGVQLDRNYITHDEIMQGGELVFKMTDCLQKDAKITNK